VVGIVIILVAQVEKMTGRLVKDGNSDTVLAESSTDVEKMTGGLVEGGNSDTVLTDSSTNVGEVKGQTGVRREQ
jgi:hypothetical protein